MRLNIKAMAVSLGVLSAVAFFLVGLANLVWPGYASQFLQIVASIYPGYEASGTPGDLVTGMLYALFDGGLLGLVLAWLYNLIEGRPTADTPEIRREGGIPYHTIEPHS